MSKVFYQLSSLSRLSFFLLFVTKLKKFLKKSTGKQGKSLNIEIKVFKKFVRNPSLLLALFFLILAIFLILNPNETSSIETNPNLEKVSSLKWTSTNIPDCLRSKTKGFYFIEYQDTSLEGYYDGSEFYSEGSIIDEEAINCYQISTPVQIQEITL